MSSLNPADPTNSISPVPDAVDLDERPDLKALEARSSESEAALRLARNKWLPDPTLRLGYVKDQYTVAGNQEQSVFAGLSAWSMSSPMMSESASLIAPLW